MTIELRYPWMREELIVYLEDIVSIDESRPGELSELDRLRELVHFLFDDTKLAADPRECIGDFLYDEAEADAAARVTTALVKVPEVSGRSVGRPCFTVDPSWKEAAKAARAALLLIRQRP